MILNAGSNEEQNWKRRWVCLLLHLREIPKADQLDSVLPKSSCCCGGSCCNTSGGNACSGATHHAVSNPQECPLASASTLQTIDLSTNGPCMGPGFVNSRRPDHRNNSSSPTVLNHREHSGSWDYLYSSNSSLETGSGGARRRTQSPGYDFRETAARRRSYQGKSWLHKISFKMLSC